MKTLNIFLKALEETLGNKRGFYVPKKTSLACKFPAYKRIVLEVWCVDGSYETLISKVDITEKSTTIEEQENLEDKVIKDTIKNILKYYGI